jgi:TatD DNase family protein
MLEKKSKIFCDAHFHLYDFFQKGIEDPFLSSADISYYSLSTAIGHSQWESQKAIISNLKIDKKIKTSFGIHPLYISRLNYKEELLYLEKLCSNNEIAAIGEAGFDFFNKEERVNEGLQKEVFESQLELAVKYHLPLIIHCRKANDYLFNYMNQFKLLPELLFHSFMGNSIEAGKFLKKLPQAFFSFGKQIANNNKKVIDCVKNLPLENLLCETDAPFQYLKNESLTFPSSIEDVYKMFIQERKEDEYKIYRQLFMNYCKLLNISNIL